MAEDSHVTVRGSVKHGFVAEVHDGEMHHSTAGHFDNAEAATAEALERFHEAHPSRRPKQMKKAEAEAGKSRRD